LPVDFAAAREFGYVLKLLAVARLSERGLETGVHPAFLKRDNPLAEVRGAFNAVRVTSAALGPSLYSGQGAGALPTGSAVVSDIIDVARNILAGVSGRLPMLCAPFLQEVPRVSPAERRAAVYLRLTVHDAPGVLGRVATVLGEQGVSIASLIQRQPDPASGQATIVLFTHEAREGDVEEAVRRIDRLPTTAAPTRRIRIEGSPKWD
jgi:homoserine dehydrogenase